MWYHSCWSFIWFQYILIVFSRKRDSRIANVCSSVCQSQKPISLSKSGLLTIVNGNYWPSIDHWPSCQSTIVQSDLSLQLLKSSVKNNRMRKVSNLIFTWQMYDVFTFEEQSKQFVINEQQSYILAYWSMEPICHNTLQITFCHSLLLKMWQKLCKFVCLLFTINCLVIGNVTLYVVEVLWSVTYVSMGPGRSTLAKHTRHIPSSTVYTQTRTNTIPC